MTDEEKNTEEKNKNRSFRTDEELERQLKVIKDKTGVLGLSERVRYAINYTATALQKEEEQPVDDTKPGDS